MFPIYFSTTKLIFACTFLGVLPHSSTSEWSYKNIESWQGDCNTGGFQSPIDIDLTSSVPKEYPPFVFTNYGEAHSGIVANSGQGIIVKFDDVPSKLEGGGLTEEYTLDNFHFHWASEHTISGQRYPLEMHLVHYASRLGNLTTAAENGGIAVLGVLFELSPDDDEEFDLLDEVLLDVLQKPEGSAPTSKLTPRSFMPRNTAGYFRYAGSLTTPECNEGVVWTIFTNTVPISQKQLDFFYKVEGRDGALSQNFRPTQPLYGRTVYVRQSPIMSMSVHSGASSTGGAAILLLTVLILEYFQQLVS